MLIYTRPVFANGDLTAFVIIVTFRSCMVSFCNAQATHNWSQISNWISRKRTVPVFYFSSTEPSNYPPPPYAANCIRKHLLSPVWTL